MNLFNRLSAYIKISRPVNVLITFLAVLVAIKISQTVSAGNITLILVPLTAAFISAAGNIINDIYDVETDRVSHPDRGLVAGSVTRKEAYFLYFMLNIVSLLIAAFLSPVLLLIALSAVVLLFLYSSHLKKLPIIGNAAVALLTGSVFIYGGSAVDNPADAVIPAIFAFLINLIREIVKDIQDIDGDIKANYDTFPIKYGITRSKRIIAVLSVIMIFFTLFPFVYGIYKIEYFAAVMCFVNPVMVLTLKLLYSSNQDKTMLISRLLKINMVLGLTAIYLGK